MCSFPRAIVFSAALSAIACGAEVDFARDVYPVLQRSCFECHGPEKQKGKLRLDTREAAFQGGDSGAAIVKGKPDESELLRRVALPKTDDDVMPNRGDLLSKTELEQIRRWIAAGAPWPDGLKAARHWAYVPPVKAALPSGGGNAIDAFVRARLQREGLPPSPDAELPILARRLHLDLTGLPPTPTEVDAFVAESIRNPQSAIRKLADRLLASPQYGEKWARPWLDAARYADSHGFQRDDLRELWPYRDWVIRALNADMPFDQFTIEQLAGDLLPNATEEQRIATGFNRCTPCNVEAGTDPEENRVNQVFDRVNTLGAVWLGTTLECTQCHDHKYDPFTMRDYYGLFSFFNNTELEAERSNPKTPGSIRFLGPYLDVREPVTDAERTRLTAEISAVKAELAAGGGVIPAEPKRARAKRAAEPASAPVTTAAGVHPLTPDDFDSAGGANHKILDDGSVLLVGDPPETDTYTITVRTALTGITGFKLEALTDDTLPGMGPGRGDPERTNFVLQEFTVTAGGQPVALTDAQADFSQANWDPSGAIDGKPKTGWAIAPQFHKPHWATFRTAAPLGSKAGAVFTFRLVQEYGNARTIGRVRISALTGAEAASPPPANPELKRLNARLAALEKSLKALGQARTLVMREVTPPRASAIFPRGDFRSPGGSIEPLTPATLHPLRSEAPRDRLALARWLVSRENPLVARVIVNRLWTELFGEGLVSTPEDFGVKGERPSHPELLDWLAVEFIENGWSQKQLLRVIVTSATYRQASRATPALIERDPKNRLLARGPRFRLSAESIRDNALAISGLLSLKQFGPPIRPPQPAGLWTKVGGEKYEYEVSPGEEQHRRGLYVVLKRMSPYPSFITFDATARLACRVKRPSSNTPLQALTLLNDPVYVAAARAFATRIVREQPAADTDARLRHGFRLAVARPPRDAELAVLRKLHADESANSADAAWFAVASALLNLDETITKN